MLFDCPHCGQTLKAADNAAGKKCRCTKCEKVVSIPGGTTRPVAPSPSSKPQAKPASVASELNDMIIRQHEQRLQDAAVVSQQQERARRRAEEQSRRQESCLKGSEVSHSSQLRSILNAVLVIFLFLGVLCCGVGGYFAIGTTTELKAGGFSITATGHGAKRVSNAGTARGEGILNRFTGSEFWLYVTTLPSDDPALATAIMDRFRSESVSSESVQRGNLSGNHFRRVAAEALNMPDNVRCDMEVFVIRQEMVVACYIAGSSKAKAGIQKKSAFEGSEESWDNPQAFFESLRTSAP